MRTIYIDGNRMQFSKSKFTQIDACWDKDKYGMTFQKFIEKNLYLDAKCFSKYKSQNGNGMDIENIEKLAKLLNRPFTDFLEEKDDNKENFKMTATNKSNEYKISDFTKSKIYELYNDLYNCMIEFFATYNVEDSMYELYSKLEVAEVAIPDDILAAIWDTFLALSKINDDPKAFYSSAPAYGDNPSIEEIQKHNSFVYHLEEEWKEKYMLSLKDYLKPYMLS